MSVEFIVRDLATRHGVDVDTTRVAYVNAVAFNRLEGVVGNKIIDLIASLMSKGVTTKEKAVSYIVNHKREMTSLCAPKESIDDGGQIDSGFRSFRWRT